MMRRETNALKKSANDQRATNERVPIPRATLPVDKPPKEPYPPNQTQPNTKNLNSLPPLLPSSLPESSCSSHRPPFRLRPSILTLHRCIGLTTPVSTGLLSPFARRHIDLRELSRLSCGGFRLLQTPNRLSRLSVLFGGRVCSFWARNEEEERRASSREK